MFIETWKVFFENETTLSWKEHSVDYTEHMQVFPVMNWILSKKCYIK